MSNIHVFPQITQMLIVLYVPTNIISGTRCFYVILTNIFSSEAFVETRIQNFLNNKNNDNDNNNNTKPKNL